MSESEISCWEKRFDCSDLVRGIAPPWRGWLPHGPNDLSTYARNVAADRKTYPLSAGAPANVFPYAFWTTKPIEKPVQVTNHGRRNILIMQNERDPAAALPGAQGMHKALGKRSVMVTADAGGHGVYGTSGAGVCATDAANAYLANGVLPRTDLVCPAQG